MRRSITLTCSGLLLAAIWSVTAHADYTRVRSIPVHFPEETYGYDVTGLETIGDSLFMTVAIDSNSAIYLIDPTDGDVFTSYFWQKPMPDGHGAPSLSGAAFEPPFYYWVCDAYSGYFLKLTWSGGDTAAIYYYWSNDRITYPRGLDYEEYATLWTVDGEVDSLYEVEPYGYIYGYYDIWRPSAASAVTTIDPLPGLKQTGNLVVCYETISDSVFEYTRAGEFVRAHYLDGSPFDGGIYAATFYDGCLYLGGPADSIFIFAATRSYSDSLPAGDDIVVHVIPDELDVGFTHVGEAGSLYVEVTPGQPCPPPDNVSFFGDVYEISTTATFDYITEVALTSQGDFPPGVNPNSVRVFVRPSGECEVWRDATVEMIELEESGSFVLARSGKRLSEDDEFSVFAFGEDKRKVTHVVALKYDYLDSTITRNQSWIPPEQYTRMTSLLTASRLAYGLKRYRLAARGVNRIADIAANTPAIPHTYDPMAAPGGNVAGRIMSRAHTLGFSLGMLLTEQHLPALAHPAWKTPPIDIVGESGVRIEAMPNPSQSEFIITFNASDGRPVSVKVYSVEGRLVRTLANLGRPAGVESLTWDGRNDEGTPVASGTYFAVLEDGEQRWVRKMVLQR